MKIKKTTGCVLFDKKNSINENFFDKKEFLKKTKKSGIKISFIKKKAQIKKFDLIFLVGFTSKIKLDKKKNYFTVHESALPYGKGHSPIKHQILKNKNIIDCCLIKLNEKIDAGSIIYKKKLKIRPFHLFDNIKKLQMNLTSDLFVKLVKNYPNYKETKQIGKSTFFPKLKPKDDKINIYKPLITQFNKIRSTNYYKYDNYFFFKKKKFVIRIHNES
jgi:methionyl-tRNA formyltransferase